MPKKNEQVQCPQCKSFKTQSISPKFRLRAGGTGLTIVGCVFVVIGLVIVIGLIIGIPVIIVGIAVLIASIFAKENGDVMCNACTYRFRWELPRMTQSESGLSHLLRDIFE